MQTAAPGTPEPAQRGNTIQALAKETGVEPTKVEELYDREFAELEATATVRIFLSVLTSRKVRTALRRQRQP
jgi:Protein of unknown function (DUF3562)